MKWEYLKVGFNEIAKDNSIKIEDLNWFGGNGWEMVAITNWNGKPAFIYFKREKK